MPPLVVDQERSPALSVRGASLSLIMREFFLFSPAKIIQEFPEAGPEVNPTEIKPIYGLCQCVNLIFDGCRGVKNQDIFSLYPTEASWKETTLPFQGLMADFYVERLSQFLKLAQKGILIQPGFPLAKLQDLGDIQRCGYEISCQQFWTIRESWTTGSGMTVPNGPASSYHPAVPQPLQPNYEGPFSPRRRALPP